MTTLRPVQRRSVPDEVAEQLVDGIVAGDLAAGELLPSERDLAEALGVSRPTVRAALTRLATTGLVETRQGGGSTVRDFRRHGGLDLLPRLLLGPDGLDLGVARDILDARTAIGPQVAARAARMVAGGRLQGTAGLGAAAAALAAGTSPVARQREALLFWDELVDLGGSIVHRLLFNQLRAAVEPVLDAIAVVLTAETDRPDLYWDLTAAVASGDPQVARALATELLTLGAAALDEAFAGALPTT